MRNYYLGGARRQRQEPGAAAECGDLWQCRGGGAELFLDAGGEHFGLFRFADLAILLRGYATFAGAAIAPASEMATHQPEASARGASLTLRVGGDGSRRGNKLSGPEDVAQAVREHYLLHGELPIEQLEGSFTVALLDGRAGRVLLYRNLVGAGFTYYCAAASGLLFASNLADLLDARGVAPRPNDGAVPAFFLYRCVPGRETLFGGVYRLMPGEMVTWEPHYGQRRVQRQTLDDLRGPCAAAGDLASRVEETLGGVVADYAAVRPGMANLLSGGVDSSYLQMLLTRVGRGGEPAPTFSLSVDNPSGRDENEYALSAAHWLGTRHTLACVDRPYPEYLLETIAATAEPPNHAQTAYFGALAREMAARGATTGLCGEGADSLFGVSSATRIQYAQVLKRLLPLGGLRGALGRLASAVGWQRLRDCAWLANRLGNFDDLRHPVNQVAVFTDWEAVHACFGARTVAAAAAYRRAMLTDYRVAADPLETVHAAGYLGEGMETAAMWATLFNREGADLLCPFMDSRVLRLVLSLEPRRRYPFRQPKGLLKAGLVRHGLRELAYRPKRGFGQPVFEWLAPGGQLRPLVERMAAYPFVDGATLARVKTRPTWFLYSLLCYDLWHKLFIDGSIPRRPRRRQEAACGLACSPGEEAGQVGRLS
jgi:asparagine synthase (glutamine-hydrolysing)